VESVSDEFEEDRRFEGPDVVCARVRSGHLTYVALECCTRFTRYPSQIHLPNTITAIAPSTYVKSVAELLPERSRAADHDRVYRSTPKAPSSNARRMSIGCMQVGHTVLILIHVAAQSA